MARKITAPKPKPKPRDAFLKELDRRFFAVRMLMQYAEDGFIDTGGIPKDKLQEALTKTFDFKNEIINKLDQC